MRAELTNINHCAVPFLSRAVHLFVLVPLYKGQSRVEVHCQQFAKFHDEVCLHSTLYSLQFRFTGSILQN